MDFKRSYNWLIGALIALFFAVQSYGVAHASEHSDAPHDHDGVACSVTVIAADDVVIMPPMPVYERILTNTKGFYYPFFISAPYTTPQNRAPPPRAPPTSI